MTEDERYDQIGTKLLCYDPYEVNCEKRGKKTNNRKYLLFYVVFRNLGKTYGRKYLLSTLQGCIDFKILRLIMKTFIHYQCIKSQTPTKFPFTHSLKIKFSAKN